jgi:hypothetical protein
MQPGEKIKPFQPQGPFWPGWGEELNQNTLDMVEE